MNTTDILAHLKYCHEKSMGSNLSVGMEKTLVKAILEVVEVLKQVRGCDNISRTCYKSEPAGRWLKDNGFKE